jgi:hypothetical protein
MVIRTEAMGHEFLWARKAALRFDSTRIVWHEDSNRLCRSSKKSRQILENMCKVIKHTRLILSQSATL